jgi:hypothetical protein
MGGAILPVLHGIRRNIAGVSVVELALMLPVLVMIGAGGIELTNYVLANQKIERIASITADNLARNTLAPSEQSFADTFAAVERIAAPFGFDRNGRIIMTGVIGVAQNGTIVPKVVWQRCSGQLRGVTSEFGSEAPDPARWAEGPNVVLPNNIAILQNQMIVISEAALRYEPMIAVAALPSGALNQIARQRSLFVTRGQAFSYVTPSPGVTPSRCN